MSMILEALRRADRERQGPASDPPNLSTVHQAPVTSGKHPHRRLVSALVLVLAGAGIGMALAYWQWSGSADQPSPSSAPRALTEPGSHSVDPSNVDPSSVGPQEPLAPHAEPAPSRAPEPEPEQTHSPAEVAQLYRAEPERSAQAPAVQRLYNPPQSEPTPSVERETRLQSEPHPLPEPEPQTRPRPSLSTEGALSIRALPSAMQQAVPSIYYQGHHHQEGQDSYVVLNRREYRPGDEVVPEVILEQIAEDGIVLSFRGERFKLARLSSWVNL